MNKKGIVRRLIDEVWRPRTEIGRRLKHFLLTGELRPPPRQGRRWREQKGL